MSFAMACQLFGSLHQDIKRRLNPMVVGVECEKNYSSTPICFIVDDAIHERNAIKYIIFPSIFHFALISFCFIYLAFINKLIFCSDLCSEIKMFIYFFCGTFSKIENNNNLKNQRRFFTESYIQRMSNVDVRTTGI